MICAVNDSAGTQLMQNVEAFPWSRKGEGVFLAHVLHGMNRRRFRSPVQHGPLSSRLGKVCNPGMAQTTSIPEI